MDAFLLLLPPRDNIETLKHKIMRLVIAVIVVITLLVTLMFSILIGYCKYEDSRPPNVAFFYKADGARL